MFHLAKQNQYLKDINQNAATNKKVNLIAEDSYTYLFNNTEKYDLIIADLPDPTNQALARLYSKQFFLMAKRNLKRDGVFVTQSGEIYFSNTVFSCIYNTLESVLEKVQPYLTYIPSFGDWGFIIARHSGTTNEVNTKALPDDLKYLNANQVEQAFIFPDDITIAETKQNTLDNPIILNYFLDEWAKWKVDFEGGTK
jgi:spermidine synthase